jgi:hypothetical protein
LREERAERFSFVEAERSDVDQAGDVGCIGAQSSHDLAAVRVTGHDSRSVLEIQNLAQSGYVA